MAEFEERAQQAENEIQALKKRLAAMEGCTQQGINASVVQKLEKLRSMLVAENREVQKVVVERNRLQDENDKLQYRVQILLRSLEEAEGKSVKS